MAFVDLYHKGKQTTPTASPLTVLAALKSTQYARNKALAWSDIINDSFKTTAYNLLPIGRAWTRRASSALSDLIEALSNEFANVTRRALALFEEMDPRTTYELLADWERIAGLSPESTDTLAERRAALHSHLLGQGDPTDALFVSIAVALGFLDAETLERDPFTCGDRSGSRIYEYGYRFRFDIVKVPKGDPLDAALDTAIAKFAPLHTYSGSIDAYSVARERTLDGAYAGTWKDAAQGSDPMLTVAVGSSAEIQTSRNLREWTAQDAAGAYAGQFNAATYGDGVFVIAGSSGEIETSSDGETWTQQTPAGGYSSAFQGAAYSPSLDLFCLVGSSAEIQTATDPTGTWTAQTPAGGYGGNFTDICWSSDFGLFIAIGSSGEIETSPDGSAWTQRSTSGGAMYVACGEGFAVTNNAGSYPLISYDGLTWENLTTLELGAYGQFSVDVSPVDNSIIFGTYDGDTPALGYEVSLDGGVTFAMYSHAAIDNTGDLVRFVRNGIALLGTGEKLLTARRIDL